MEKFLPIGTVVLLKEAEKRVMIIGFCPVIMDNNREITYDYSGCLFPEGVISSEENILFNHDQIDKLYCYGLVDEEQKDFMIRLKEAIEEDIISIQDNIELPYLNNNIQIETLDINE